MHLSLWDEALSLETVFQELSQSGHDHDLSYEMARRLLLQRKLAEYGIHVSDEDRLTLLKTVYAKQCAKLRKQPDEAILADETQLLSQLKLPAGQSLDTFKARLVFQEGLRRLKQTVISQQAIDQVFVNRKSALDNALFALIRVPSLAQAQQLYAMIMNEGKDFSQLAHRFSVGPEAKTGGGMVGPVSLVKLNPGLRQQLLKLSPGQVSEPFVLDEAVDEAARQVMLVRLIRVTAAKLTPDLADRYRHELFDQWLSRQLALANIRLVNGSRVSVTTATTTTVPSVPLDQGNGTGLSANLLAKLKRWF